MAKPLSIGGFLATKLNITDYEDLLNTVMYALKHHYEEYERAKYYKTGESQKYKRTVKRLYILKHKLEDIIVAHRQDPFR